MSTPQQPRDPTPEAAEPGKGQLVKLLLVFAALGGAGYVIWQQVKPRDAYKAPSDPSQIVFKDGAQSNVPLGGGDVGKLQFVNAQGMPVALEQFQGKKNVVLVVTRGNTSGSPPGAYIGKICLYCATQTSRLVANYKAFEDAGAEVVVVFPVQRAADSNTVDDFNKAVKRDQAASGPIPFPLVLDVELRAVDQLGIRADLSKPATYILDKQGQVRFAYVGASLADRPSVQSMLDQLVAINADSR